jgi:hypothetical protein
MRYLAALPLVLLACEAPVPPSPGPPEEVLIEVDLEYSDASFDATETPSVDWEKVLGSYSTKYATLGAKAARAKNIERAALSLVGTELQPGDKFSFNVIVGPRSKENGFLVAPIIFDGEMSLDVGGGVCQVSSTLHAAILRAGILPVFRRPHSRWSSYIFPGLDATVIYPPECGDQANTAADGGTAECWSVDFTFENPYPFPIGIGGQVRDVKKGVKRLEISILGGDPPNVDVRRTISYKEPFLQEFRRGRRLKDDEAKKVQKGKRGSLVRTIITFKPPEKHGIQNFYSHTHKSFYKPVTEIWEVGPLYDMDGPPPWEPRIELDAGVPDSGVTREQGTDAG